LMGFLAEQFCPWKEHLMDLEEELNLGNQIKYVIFEDSSKSWRVQCVPLKRDSFQNRSFILFFLYSELFCCPLLSKTDYLFLGKASAMKN
jgi:hypothetical protein